MLGTLVFWALFLFFVGTFLVQIGRRVRLIVAGPNNFSFDNSAVRLQRFVTDVLLQRRTVAGRPMAGLAHALVFWGFVSFAGYTSVHMLRGLGIVDLTRTSWFHAYGLVLVPFAIATLAGILFLLVRRVFVRPAGLGTTVSAESVVIGLFIVTLMTTFLLEQRLQAGTVAGEANWWVHMLVILAFLALIPQSKHLHLLLSPITVPLKSPVLGSVPNLDFEKEEVGLETVRDLPAKQRLDAFTCVECGRCQVNCPAWGSGKTLNPKRLILRNRAGLMEEKHDTRLVDLYEPGELWQCTTCGACENECPVGIEHLPLIIGARRGDVSDGRAPEYLTGLYNNMERRGNIWGLLYDQRQKFMTAAGLEVFDPAKHEYLVWLGCAGAFEADYQNSLRALFEILRARGVRFGVLAKERCNGDPGKRTGNEYLFQELASQNIAELKQQNVTKILTSCPHCLKTLGDDYRRCGYEAEVTHSAVFVEELTRGLEPNTAGLEEVTFHDPCYLGRYAGKVDEPRQLIARFGGSVAEPERNRSNPFCCGAGGGLLFQTEEDDRREGRRISDVRFEQLRATGAGTVVTACPFCSIMLKGAQASAGADTQFVDLMTFVNGRMRRAGEHTVEPTSGTQAPAAAAARDCAAQRALGVGPHAH